MSRYLQVYSVELTLITNKVINPKDDYLFYFSSKETTPITVLCGGINVEYERIFCFDSIVDTGVPKLGESFIIMDADSKEQIGNGKVLKILAQE